MSPTSQQPTLTFESLKQKQRAIRHGFPDDVGLRVHRAISWVRRAEMATEDDDARFIFYWIAFNAAYAEDRETALQAGERSAFEGYFERLIALDTSHLIYDAIWQRFSDPIRLLLDNRYVFQPFWNFHNRVSGYADWEERFAKSKRRSQIGLANRDTKLILTTVFDRLYVLRNQLVHGGATWNSAVNRSQVRDGATIMAFLVPLFIDLMMDNPHVVWGPPYYPVLD